MKSVNKIIIKWLPEYIEIGIPLCTTKKNDMFFIYCSDRCGYLLYKGSSLGLKNAVSKNGGMGSFSRS